MRSTVTLASAAVICGLVSSAGAATIMQTETFGPNTPNYAETLTFDQFDDMGGTRTLLSIKVKMEMNVFNGSAIVDNDGVDPAAVTIEFGASGAISSTDVPLLNAAVQPVTSDVDVFTAQNYNLDPNHLDPMGQFDDDGGLDNGYLTVVPDSDMDMGFIGAAFFGPYIGVGDFDVDVTIDTLFNIIGVGGVAGAFVPVTADGNVMITYEWEPVPTPGAFALLGIAGVATTRRRRA